MESNLITTAKAEVVWVARELFKACRAYGVSGHPDHHKAITKAEGELLGAVALLEERERMVEQMATTTDELEGYGEVVEPPRRTMDRDAMTAPHNSATCSLGADGGPCEMCAVVGGYDLSRQQREGAAYAR